MKLQPGKLKARERRGYWPIVAWKGVETHLEGPWRAWSGPRIRSKLRSIG